MSAIHSALDTLYADPNIGETAMLDPTDGSPYQVRVVAERSEQSFDMSGMPIRTKVRILNVRKKEVPVLRKGYQFHFNGGWMTIGGSTLEVIEDPSFDHVNGEWTAQVVERAIPD